LNDRSDHCGGLTDGCPLSLKERVRGITTDVIGGKAIPAIMVPKTEKGGKGKED
jgi:hypothetical protein